MCTRALHGVREFSAHQACRLHNSGHPTPKYHCQRARSRLQNTSSRRPTPWNNSSDKGQHLYCFPSNDVFFHHAGWCVVLFPLAGQTGFMVVQSIRHRSTRLPWSSSVMRVPKLSGKPTATSSAWGMFRLTTTNPWNGGLNGRLRRSLNVNSIHGPVVNPFQASNARDVPWTDRERRCAGGSSGGSAASVAAGMCAACVSSLYLGIAVILTCNSKRFGNRHRWIREAARLVLWCRGAQALVRSHQ